jgi:hypothetical protein
MNVTLEQAIAIHARALKSRAGKRSRRMAELRAQSFKARGDLEGFRVWMLVGEQAERLIAAEAEADKKAFGC